MLLTILSKINHKPKVQIKIVVARYLEEKSQQAVLDQYKTLGSVVNTL